MHPPLPVTAKRDSNSHLSQPKTSLTRCEGRMRHFVTELDGTKFNKTGCRETSLGGIAQLITLIYIAKSSVGARSTDPPRAVLLNRLPRLHRFPNLERGSAGDSGRSVRRRRARFHHRRVLT